MCGACDELGRGFVKRFRVLPLGVDIGASRARLAVCERGGDEIRLCAVSARDVPRELRDDPAMYAALLEEMLAELGVRERRCVSALAACDAVLRVIAFPNMTRAERFRAARYEAERFMPAHFGAEAITVRVHRATPQTGSFSVGVARDAAVNERIALLREARLQPVALDFAGLALRRIHPLAHAILDIGHSRSTLHTFSTHPHAIHIERGGHCLTQAIACELSIDERSAERRKRILGAAGTGASARESLLAAISDAVTQASARFEMSRIAIVGNGGRIPFLAGELQKATGAMVEMPVASIFETSAYPEDVLRAAAPDWSLAVALATWAASA